MQAPALLAVCKQVLSEANEVDTHIAAALENNVQLTDLFDQCHMFLTPAEHSLALQKAELFLDNSDWLNKWALEEGRKLFDIEYETQHFPAFSSEFNVYSSKVSLVFQK